MYKWGLPSIRRARVKPGNGNKPRRQKCLKYGWRLYRDNITIFPVLETHKNRNKAQDRQCLIVVPAACGAPENTLTMIDGNRKVLLAYKAIGRRKLKKNGP